jgi:hypothetical protein
MKNTVAWHPVITGIRQDGRVQIHGENLTGQVVTLGHQMLDHGSLIRIPDQANAPVSDRKQKG